MAPGDLATAEAKWREQFEAMRAALAALKLPSHDKGKAVDTDLEDDDFEGYSSGNSGRDVWDFISDDADDEEEDSGSDFSDADGAVKDGGYGPEWLASRCSTIAIQNGMSPDVFQTQIMSVLTSRRPDEELQAELTDLIGFGDLDFIIELLANKTQVVARTSSQAQTTEPASRRLLTKAQREEALRIQDYEHKNATLAARQSGEPQYPHVYKAYSAGNTLSITGKKYGLPVGHTHQQFEKYEEYSIPAGRKGVPGPGERLVKISELDGLCRNTFKGYKSLNRMQSLVYPVAYKTSENMLICAPTGAVSFEINCLAR